MFRRYRGLPSYSGSGIETKFHDTTVTSASIPAPPSSATWSGLDTLNPTTTLCFNSMAQGSGASQREGRKITMQSLEVTGIVSTATQSGQSALDTLGVVKLWIVLDTQTNGGTATGIDSENVFTNPSALASVGLTPLRNMLYTKRYKVLREIEIQPQPLPAVAEAMGDIEQAGNHSSFKMFIPLRGLTTEYSGVTGSGTVADVVTNGLFILAATSSTLTAPTLCYNARLRYRG